MLEFKPAAEKIIGSIDPADVPFVAASLSYGSCPIWSDDKDFKRQNQIEIYSTAELINLLSDNNQDSQQ